MHRIHAAHLMQAGGFSKFWLGKSFVSASVTGEKRSHLFFGTARWTGRICSEGQPLPRPTRPFQLVRSALGWQRQELVILVSALAQSLLNSVIVVLFGSLEKSIKVRTGLARLPYREKKITRCVVLPLD